MPSPVFRPFNLLFCLGLTLLLWGCPVSTPPTLSVSPTTLEFAATDTSRAVSISFDGGTLDWTAAANRPWIELSAASGSGNSQLNVSVDRTGLDVAQANSGVITIAAGTQSATVTVTVPAELSTSELATRLLSDFATHDADMNGLLSFSEARGAFPGLTQLAFNELDANRDGSLSESEIQAIVSSEGGDVGSEATPIDTAYFPMAIGNSWTYASGNVLGSGNDGIRMTVVDQFDTGGFEIWQVDFTIPQLLLGLGRPAVKGLGIGNILGEEASIETFWVFVNGGWHLAISRESLDGLPNNAQLISLEKLFSLPTSLAYLQASGLLEVAIEELGDIVTGAQEANLENQSALYEYLSTAVSENPEAIFALLQGFGAEFEDYDGGDPHTDALVHLLADLGIGAEPIVDFFNAAGGVLSDTAQQLGGLQELPISLEFWTAWEGMFGADYTNTNPVVEGWVSVLSVTALELSILGEEQPDASAEDMAAYNAYVTALFEAINDNAGLFLMDTKAFIEAIQTFAEGYTTANPAAQSIVDATLNVLAEMEMLVTAIEENEPFPLDLVGFSLFLDEGIAFGEDYIETNGDNPAAEFMTVLLNGADGLVAELAIVAPTLDGLAADVNTLRDLAPTVLLPTFSLSTYAAALADFGVYFEGYAASEEDALATTLAIWTSAISESLGVVVGLVDAIDSAPYEDMSGSLESLLPELPGFPMAFTLDAFGIGNPADCIASGISVTMDGETYTVASNIFARNLGPAMFFFLPLQYGVVNGTIIGETPVAVLAQELLGDLPGSDTNSDGVLSLVEAQAAIPGLTEDDFDRMDRDNNGRLSSPELALTAAGADDFEIDDDSTNARPIAFGEVQTHSFHVVDDADWVKFEVSEPSLVAVTMVGDGSYRSFSLTLYDASLTELNSIISTNPQLRLDIVDAGTYFVLVTQDPSYSFLTDEYQLGLERIVPDEFEVDDSSGQASTIDIGEVQNRNFHSNDDQDWVSFEIMEATAIDILATSSGGDDYFYMRLFDASMNEIAQSQSYEPRISQWLAAAGTYYVSLTPDSYYVPGLSYVLTVEPVPAADPDSYENDDTSDQASSIEINDYQFRTLHVNDDQDWVAFEVDGPTGIQVELYGRAPYTTSLNVSLFDATLEELATSEDGQYATLNYNIDDAGTYYLRITSPGNTAVPGTAYDLDLYEVTYVEVDSYEVDDSPDQASNIDVDSPQSHNFHDYDDSDWVSFEITEPSERTISTLNPDAPFYTTLTLYDSSINYLAYNDDDFGGPGSSITYYFETPGTYYVLIDSYDAIATDSTYDVLLEATNTITPES